MRALMASPRNVVTAIALLASAAPGWAQGPQPLVLVHGYRSDGSSWASTSSYFQQKSLPVQSFAWNLNWWDRLYTQGDQLVLLTGQASLPDTTILIGHSNGGLISRYAARSRPYKGIITVGTLHSGAQLAASVEGGEVEGFGAFIAMVATNAARDYNTNGSGDTPFCDDTYDYCDWFNQFAFWAAYAEAAIGGAIAEFSTAFLAQALVSDGGALNDMQPYSGFLNTLNSQDNLNHEAQLFGPRRVGIASHYTGNTLLIWAGIDPDHALAWSSLSTGIWQTMILAYDYYSNYDQYDDPNYWWKVEAADDWLVAAAPLATIDLTWCSLIGAGDLTYCGDSDAIVPVASQRYPGANVTNVDIYGPAHTQEKDSDAFQSTAYNYLVNLFSVHLTSSPAVNVSIVGDYPTQAGNYTYSASASGGTGSYSYRWYISYDGSNYYDAGDTSSSYTIWIDSSTTYWLRVDVTSGTSTGSAVRFIQGPCSTGAIIC